MAAHKVSYDIHGSNEEDNSGNELSLSMAYDATGSGTVEVRGKDSDPQREWFCEFNADEFITYLEHALSTFKKLHDSKKPK